MRHHVSKCVRRKRTPKTKEILYYHTKKRIRERYGFICTKVDYDSLVLMIQHIDKHDSPAVFLQRQSLNITIWKVTYKHKEFILVYDKTRHAIVTALPPGTTDFSYER